LPMAQLLSTGAAQGIMPDYVGKLLAVFDDTTNDKGQPTESSSSSVIAPSSLIEPLRNED